MRELDNLVASAEKADAVASLMDGVNPHHILAIDEAFRALEQRAEAAEAKLAVLEKQEPFMYGIMTANGDAHFEDFCVSSDPGLLEDVIWEWNNSLADNEPKNRVVPLFTRPAPAVSLAELVPDEKPDWESEDGQDIDYMEPSDVYRMGKDDGWNACRSAILRNIEEEKK